MATALARTNQPSTNILPVSRLALWPPDSRLFVVGRYFGTRGAAPLYTPTRVPPPEGDALRSLPGALAGAGQGIGIGTAAEPELERSLATRVCRRPQRRAGFPAWSRTLPSSSPPPAAAQMRHTCPYIDRCILYRTTIPLGRAPGLLVFRHFH
eukprot:scaffold5363_cov400-Prasinococcus_capsulatus_cf.AAC.6